MNRRKSDQPTPVSVIAALILAAATAAGGGVLHAVFKNRQVQAMREIDATERRIGQYQLDIQTYRMRMDERLNRYAMRQELELAGSSLRPIPLGVTEDVAGSQRASVAAADYLSP
jgi:hypothetical protein